MNAPERPLSAPRTRSTTDGSTSSQLCPVTVPPRLQVPQKSDELRVVPDPVEIFVPREVGVAGPAAVRRLSQPVHGAGRLAEQGIHCGDVVRGVMKMDVAGSHLDGRADILLLPRRISHFGEQDGAAARYYATTVLRVLPQVALHQSGCFFVPAQIEQGPGNLIVPARLVRLGRDLPGPFVY